MVAALPVGDPRVEQSSLSPSDFDGRPLIMYSRMGAGYFNNMLTRLFEAAGALPEYVQHVTQIHSMLGLVRAGLAAAIVPASAIELHMDDIQFRKFATLPEQPVELQMAWRRDNGNPALQPMLRLCAEFGSRDRLTRPGKRQRRLIRITAHLSVAAARRSPAAAPHQMLSCRCRCVDPSSVTDSMRCSA